MLFGDVISIDATSNSPIYKSLNLWNKFSNNRNPKRPLVRGEGDFFAVYFSPQM